jgi:hypothetical protein
MIHRLIARDRIFCEGTMAECQKALTDISIMMDIFSTDFAIEEFVIVVKNDELV